jgi:hypothetical protein
MFDDEDAETAAKKSVPSQYQFAPVAEKPAAPAAAVPKQANERKKSPGKEVPKTDGADTKADKPGTGTKPRATAKENAELKEAPGPPVGFTCTLDGKPGEITRVDRAKGEFSHSTSETPVPFADVPNRIRFLVDPEHPDKDVSNYFAAPNLVNETPGKLDEDTRHTPLAGNKKPQQASAAEPNQRTTNKGRRQRAAGFGDRPSF